MDQTAFYNDLDEMIDRGVNTHPEYDVDLGAFQFLRRIKSKLRTSNIFLFVFLGLFLLLVAALIFLFIKPQYLSAVGFNVPKSESKAVVTDTVKFTKQISRLESENEGLKLQVANLDSTVKDLQTPKSDQTDGYQNGGDIGSDGVIRHVVERGETLYSLAAKYYGTGRMVYILAEDNALPDPDILPTGKTLKIYPEKKVNNL